MAAALTTDSDEAEEACGKLCLGPYEWPSSALVLFSSYYPDYSQIRDVARKLALVRRRW
jgi:hypothetical protein